MLRGFFLSPFCLINFKSEKKKSLVVERLFIAARTQAITGTTVFHGLSATLNIM